MYAFDFDCYSGYLYDLAETRGGGKMPKLESTIIPKEDWLRFKEIVSSLRLNFDVMFHELVINGYKVTTGITSSNIRKVKKMIVKERIKTDRQKQMTFII